MADESGNDRQNDGGSDADALLRELLPDDTEVASDTVTIGPRPTDPTQGRPTPDQAPPVDAPSATDEQAEQAEPVHHGTAPATSQKSAENSSSGKPATGQPSGAPTPDLENEQRIFRPEAVALGDASQRANATGGMTTTDDPDRKRRRVVPWLLTLCTLAAVVIAIIFGLGFLDNSGSDSETETATPQGPSTDDADTTIDASSDDATSEVSADDSAAAVAADDDAATASDDDATVPPAGADGGPSLSLKLEDYQFTATGVVPDEQLKEAIEERAGLVFAEFGTVDISVDPSVEMPAWAEAAPSVINAMVLLHEGTIDVTSDATVVGGRGLEGDFEMLEMRLSPDLGFPPFSVAESDVIDSPAPWVTAVADGEGTLVLTGELADETMRQSIVDGVTEIYGEENVIDGTEVNSERHNRFLIMRFPSNVAAYRVFGSFEIAGRNESFEAILDDGLVFESNNTDLTAESRERLSTVMFTLTRNPLPVAVTGHTDAVGSELDNQALSEQRAKSVADFLIESGVQADLVTTEGQGESNPIDSNRTDEGRARNRRVEISIGLPDDEG